MAEKQKYLIIGLGNIGSEYEDTRHNIGFLVVEKIADKFDGKFVKKPKLFSEVAKVLIKEKEVFLIKPTTYMNLSGKAFLAAKDYYKIPTSNVLVVVDDIAIPFLEYRLKKDSGCGGHKGLENIEKYLGSVEYTRLRIGVGDRKKGDLSSHVLGKFSKTEKEDLPKVIDKAIEIIHLWLEQGITVAMNHANVRRTKQIDKDVDNEK